MSSTKIGEHIPCGYLKSKIRAFDHIANKYTLYQEKYCVKTFCESLTEHAKNIIDFEKKNVIVNERRIKITTTCKRMLHLWKNNLRKIG